MANPFDGDYGTVSGQSRGFQSRGVDVSALQRDVGNAVLAVQQQTSTLRRLCGQVGTASDTPELRKRISQLRRSTQQQLQTASAALAELVADGQGSTDTRLRLSINSLKQSVQKEGGNFVAVSEALHEKLQNHPAPHEVDSPHGYLDSGADEVEMSGERARLLRPGRKEARADPPESVQQQQQQFMVSDELVYAEERADKMQELETDILTLHNMMGQIGNLVVLQGEDIQTIEAAVESVASNVTMGNKQLGKAVRYKRCSRKLICVLLIILLVILVIIAIVIAVLVVKLRNH